MKYPPYKDYKDSGIDWLGEIPRGWGISKFRHVVSTQKGKAPDVLFDSQITPNQVPYLTMEYLRCNAAETKWTSPDSKTKLATNLDILLLWDGSNAGEFITARDGAVSSTMALLNNKALHQKYFFYVCKTVEKEIKQMTIGMGIPHVNGDYLKENLIPIPTIQEQTAIATFLNHETSKIDALIAEQARLIDLLKEKRHAIVSHAVTKGINPDASMKDSEIEWLGLLPKHWKLLRLRYVLELNPSKSEISQLDKSTLVSFLPMDNISIEGSLCLARLS
jgi:type I restriction enzyme, S subunit